MVKTSLLRIAKELKGATPIMQQRRAATPRGMAGFDNPRENIDPRVVDTRILTAKGDLFVRGGNGKIVKLAVGSNDQVLTADSAQANGIKWAAAASAAMDYAQADVNNADSTTTSTTYIDIASATATITVSTTNNPILILFCSAGGPNQAASVQWTVKVDGTDEDDRGLVRSVSGATFIHNVSFQLVRANLTSGAREVVGRVKTDAGTAWYAYQSRTNITLIELIA